MAVFVISGEYGTSPYGDEFYGGTGNPPEEIQERICWFVDNQIEDVATTVITADSTQTGFLSNVRASAVGAGSMIVQGDYSGNDQTTIVVKINDDGSTFNPSIDSDDIGKIGFARYFFSIDNGDTFFTNGLVGFLTSSDPVDTPVNLTNLGIEIFFGDSQTAGVSSFIVDDEFIFIAYRNFLATNLLNWDKQLAWRSNTDQAIIDVDFGVGSILINGFALHKHNLSKRNGDLITLQASNTAPPAGFITPEIEVDVDYVTEVDGFGTAAFIFLSDFQQFRYWRVKLTGPGGAATFDGRKPEAVHMFLGNIQQLTKDINKGFTFEQRRFVESTEFRTGQSFESINGLRRFFQSQFTNLKNEDRDRIVLVWAKTNPVGQPARAFYTINLPSFPSDYLYSLFNQDKISIDFTRRDRVTWQMNLKEG